MNLHRCLLALAVAAGVGPGCKGAADGRRTPAAGGGGGGGVVIGASGGSSGEGGGPHGSGGNLSGAAGATIGTGGAAGRGGGGPVGVGLAGATGSGGRGGGGVPAGASGGGPGGAPGGSGDPCSARAGLKFCDDFENAGATLTPPWAVQLNGSGTVAVDTSAPAHSGTRSVHVRGGESDFDTLLVFHDPTVLPAVNGRFFFRAFMRLGRPMSEKHNTFIMADLAANLGGGNSVRISEMYGMLMYTVAGDAHGALSNQNYYIDGKPGIVFAPMTWVCVEVLLDHAHPEFDVWVDGAEVPDLHHTDFPLDSFDTLRFGFEKYGGPALDVWYDDIAVGTARIGCD